MGRKARRILDTMALHYTRISQLAEREEVNEQALLRFLHDTAEAPLEVLLLALADVQAICAESSPKVLDRVAQLAEKLVALIFPVSSGGRYQPLISGEDVMSIMCLSPGEAVGSILREIRDGERDGRFNSREEVLEWLKKKKAIRIRLINIRHPFNEAPDLAVLVKNELGVKDNNLLQVRILRRSIDSRQERIDFVYTLFIELAVPAIAAQQILARGDVEPYREPQKTAIQPIAGIRSRPVIIGCGPAGLFAALTLVERGVKPVLIERGARMAQRVRDVDEFWKSGKLDAESNVLFGEGGAGTFSDGKLTTRIKSTLKDRVLSVLVRFGAPEEILYVSKPHLGTDQIRRIISRVVEHLEQSGVEFMFNTRVQALQVSEGRICGVQAEGAVYCD